MATDINTTVRARHMRGEATSGKIDGRYSYAAIAAEVIRMSILFYHPQPKVVL